MQGRARAFERVSVLPALAWDSLSFVSCSEKGSYEGAGLPSVQRFFKARLCQGVAGDATTPACPAGRSVSAQLVGQAVRKGGQWAVETVGLHLKRVLGALEQRAGGRRVSQGAVPGREKAQAGLCLELMLLPSGRPCGELGEHFEVCLWEAVRSHRGPLACVPVALDEPALRPVVPVLLAGVGEVLAVPGTLGRTL